MLERLAPDVVVTFGDDGGFGHPDHMTSSHAVLAARAGLAHPPRVLHARFPAQDRLLLDLLVDWLTSGEQRFTGTAGFGNALRLFADGSSVLGFAADHLQVQWFPAGSFVIEQGEPANELFCLLTGSVDIVVEDADGTLRTKDTAGPGSFVGQDGLATGRPRNAHVVARDDVTCFVLAPRGRDLSAGRGITATGPTTGTPELGAARRGRTGAAGRGRSPSTSGRRWTARSPRWSPTARSTRWTPSCCPARSSGRCCGPSTSPWSTRPDRGRGGGACAGGWGRRGRRCTTATSPACSSSGASG